MSQSSIGSKIVPAAIALVVGLGAAGAPPPAVVNSFSPDDAKARTSGPVEALPPEQIAKEILGYGE